MKTNKSFVGLLLIFSISVMMVSCGKENLTGTNDVSTAVISGGIMDLGVVEGNVHGMHVSLSNVQISLTDKPAKSALKTDNRLNMYLQTESDGIIKDGVYHFSVTSNASPFIFRTGLVYMLNKQTGSTDSFGVSGGTVVVARTGTYYTFNLTGTLSNGNPIHASFGGSLSYSD